MEMKLAVCLILILGHSHSSFLPSRKVFSLEELIPLRIEFFPERLAVQWISDTEYIYKDAKFSIRKYNALTNEDVAIFSDTEFSQIFPPTKDYSVSLFSNDGEFALVTTNREKVYRYSTVAEYLILHIANRTLEKLGEGLLQVVIWGGNKSLAFVQNNNVFYVPDVTQPKNIRTLTTEGIPGEVYLGSTDWIYEEEIFNSAEGLWFSPDGTYLAVATFNDTKVESAIYPFYGDPVDISSQYPEMVQFKYPKPGHTNPEVGLRVYKVNDLEVEPWNIPAPVNVIGIDHILGKVSWAAEHNLVVLWLNRRQSISVLVNCELLKDKCSIVKEQTEPNGWVDIYQPFFNKNGTQMIDVQPLYHGDQRYSHAGRFNLQTFTTEDLSPGNSTVTEILGWNLESDTVFYEVAPGNMPWLRQIWATSGGVVRCITCKQPSCRYVSSMFSPGASYAIITCSACNIPPKMFLYNTKQDTFKLLLENTRLSSKLQEYNMPKTLFTVLQLEVDVMANVKLLLPPDFTTSKKYPMIVRVYAGPGTSRVKDNFDLEYYNTYLAVNRSFIVASIDARGSGVLGIDMLHAVNTALGTVEIIDTLAAIRQLKTLYSFIDRDRIGVWGWSYGGYATTMMLIQDDKDTITCGAAVAPVTSWLYYDSIYTERYMDTPYNNPVGYQRSDLILNYEHLRGRKYLLVHGSADDNVHYQHSMQLAKQLQHADIAFEQMSYADENHSLMGVSRHFYHTLDRFWTDCFNKNHA